MPILTVLLQMQLMLMIVGYLSIYKIEKIMKLPYNTIILVKLPMHLKNVPKKVQIGISSGTTHVLLTTTYAVT